MLNLFLSLLFVCCSFAGVIDQVTIAVKDIDKAAKLFSDKGFTLKVPHEYTEGHQNGLIVQSIRFKDGSYLQLVAVKSPKGELSKWYRDFLKGQEGGATLVLKQNNLNQLQKDFEEVKLESKFSKFSDHHWLSFKTDTPLQNISFIDYQKIPNQVPELYRHKNGSQKISSLVVNPQGKAEDWAKVMTLSQSQNANLEFSALTFQSTAFISEIKIKSQSSPLPLPFEVGKTKISFTPK